MDASINAPQKLPRTVSEWVWFEGATALAEGQGVCYNFDYGTAATRDSRRYNRVELPSQSNALHFAGVAARAYSAKTGGQLVEIYRPGSVCDILLMADAVIGVGVVTCQAGGTYAGYFTRAGFEGEGSAVPLQTVSAASTAAKCLAALQVGPPSGLVEVVTPLAAGGATTVMACGKTFFAGTVSLAAAATARLADGAYVGQKKGYECEGTYTTNEFVVTVTHGERRVRTGDGAVVALATASFNADGEKILLVWSDGVWTEQYSTGATLA